MRLYAVHAVDWCPHQITHELLIELELSDSYRQQEAHLPLEGEHSEQSLQGMIPIRQGALRGTQNQGSQASS